MICNHLLYKERIIKSLAVINQLQHMQLTSRNYP